jgi:hypothetical protein
MAIVCTITEGTTIPCGNAGGAYELWVAKRPAGLTVTPATDKITDIDQDGAATALTFFKFEVVNGTLTRKTPSVSENGSTGYTKSIECSIAQMSQENNDLVEPLEHGETIAIVKDKNGKYWLDGRWQGLRNMGAEAGSGAAITDLNGYMINIGCEENKRSNEIDSTDIVTAVTGLSITVTSA